MALCHRLLAETGVATAPGDFDTVAGDRFVRLSFAGLPRSGGAPPAGGLAGPRVSRARQR